MIQISQVVCALILFPEDVAMVRHQTKPYEVKVVLGDNTKKMGDIALINQLSHKLRISFNQEVQSTELPKEMKACTNSH